MTLTKLAPVSGIVGIGGVLTGLALDNFPDGSYDNAAVAHWFDLHGTGRWFVSGAAIAIGGTLLLVFGSVLAARAEASGASPMTVRLTQSAGNTWAVLTMIGGALWLSPPLALSLFEARPTSGLLLMGAPAYSTLVSVCAFAAALLAAALTTASRRTGMLPRWLTHLGYPAAVLMLTNVVLPMAVITLWFVAVAVSLVRRPVPEQAPVATVPAMA